MVNSIARLTLFICSLAKYPSPSDVEGLSFDDAMLAFELVNHVSHAMRSLKQDYQLSQKRNIQFYVHADDGQSRSMLGELVSDIQVLGSGKVAILESDKEKPKVWNSRAVYTSSRG